MEKYSVYYKLFIGLLTGFLVACSGSDQATSANEAIANLPKSEEPISMEKAREMAEAVEKEYYANKPKPVAPATVPKDKKLPMGHFSIGGFVMSETGFSDVSSKFGEAEVVSHDKGEHHPEEKHTCYVSENENDATLVLIGTGFYSGYKDFNSVEIYSDKQSYQSLDLCSASTLVSKEIATNSGIKLFMNVDDLSSILNGEGALKGDSFVYKGGYVEKDDNGRKYYYHQNIVAETNSKKEVIYFKIAMESELY